MAGKRESRAERTASMMCLQFKIKNLSEPEKHAVHAFRHKVVSAMHELYQVIPVEKADPILNDYFKDPKPVPERVQRVLDKANSKT